MKKITYKILSDYRNFIMGIAMISIIIFHFAEDSMNAKYMYNGITKLFKTNIGSAGVDLFLMMSGLGLVYSMKKNSDINQFYKRRFVKILIPYFMVAIPSIIWLCINYNYDVLYFFKEILFINLIKKGTLWYWYILFIILCYIIFPLIFNFTESSKKIDIVQIKIFNLCNSILLLSILMCMYNKVFFARYNIMLLRLLPFFIGVLLGYYSYNKKKINIEDYLLLFIGLIFIKFTHNKNLIIQRHSMFIWFSSFVILFVIFFSKINKYKVTNIIKNIIDWFGKYSLEIYLLHVTIRKVFNANNMLTCKINYFIFYLVISLALVPLINYLSKKFIAFF